MKIVSCFSNLNELEPLAEAGADEFYAAAGELPAFHSGALPLADLAPAVKKIRALGKKLAVAVNALLATATKRQLAAIERKIRCLDGLGVDAFIFSSPYLLDMFSGPGRRLRAQLHLSSVQPVFNSLSAAFFSRFGLSRIILPNQLSPGEARGVLAFCRANAIETEIFDYRFFGCAYVNGRCQLHRAKHYTLKTAMSEGSLCRISGDPGGSITPRSLDLPERAAELPGLIKRLESRLGRGGSPRLSDAASFFDFYSAGVQYLKYGTRQDPPEVKVRKVRAMRAMLRLARRLSSTGKKAAARREFIREMSSWNGEGF